LLFTLSIDNHTTLIQFLTSLSRMSFTARSKSTDAPDGLPRISYYPITVTPCKLENVFCCILRYSSSSNRAPKPSQMS
jgi:hypothetical protein